MDLTANFGRQGRYEVDTSYDGKQEYYDNFLSLPSHLTVRYSNTGVTDFARKFCEFLSIFCFEIGWVKGLSIDY